MENQTLESTVSLMNSPDYKDRFIAEYRQTKIRRDKLAAMCVKWDAGALDFTPTCPRSIYDEQIDVMDVYLNILERRAAIENIQL